MPCMKLLVETESFFFFYAFPRIWVIPLFRGQLGRSYVLFHHQPVLNIIVINLKFMNH